MKINGKTVIITAIISLILIAGIVFVFYIQNNTIRSVGDKYLTFSNGTTSKIYLINSNATYGTFEEDIYNGLAENYTVKKGDPCVILDGTIRSDYDDFQVVLLTAQLFDKNEQQVGAVAMSFLPYEQNFPALVNKSINNGTARFKLFIKYDIKDVKNYEIYVQGMPQYPP
jgi:hypothetical protein